MNSHLGGSPDKKVNILAKRKDFSLEVSSATQPYGKARSLDVSIKGTDDLPRSRRTSLDLR
jgi:hypothetical protein